LELESIEQKHSNPQNIGLAIQKGLRMVDAKKEKKERVWNLAGKVNSEFESEWEEWSDASNWDV